LEIGGGFHEIFSIVPTGLVGITCCGDFPAALNWSSVSRYAVKRNITKLELYDFINFIKRYCKRIGVCI
jgi:hypothetical protein